MTENKKQGVFPKHALTHTELKAIDDLAEICERHDGLDLRLGSNIAQSLGDDSSNGLAYYRDDLLVGFLSLEGLGSSEAEASGMVHPQHRRQGVFRALVAAAEVECRRSGSGALLFYCDHHSESAKAFLEAIGARFVFAEHRMRLEQASNIPPPDPRLNLQAAAVADAGTIARILADDIGTEAQFLAQKIAADIQRQARQYYIARLGGDLVGTINVDVIDGNPYIYGFVVLPEYRGRGYGRQILGRTIEAIQAGGQRSVFIEVESDNRTALSLYRSVGFAITHTHDYYRKELV
jgi:ribosomal protein S18 acetylase RimI-like enzyme